jgi:hypothetical protein
VVEVASAEVSEGALQHVEGGDQDLVRDGNGGLLRADARPQPVKLAAQVAALVRVPHTAAMTRTALSLGCLCVCRAASACPRSHG